MQRPKRRWLRAAAKHHSQAPQRLRNHPLYGLPSTTQLSPSSRSARQICYRLSDLNQHVFCAFSSRTPFWLTMLPMPQLSWITPKPGLPPAHLQLTRKKRVCLLTLVCGQRRHVYQAACWIARQAIASMLLRGGCPVLASRRACVRPDLQHASCSNGPRSRCRPQVARPTRSQPRCRDMARHSTADDAVSGQDSSGSNSQVQRAQLVSSDDTNLLQTALAAAIANEDYQLASQLRDRLQEVRQELWAG